MRQQKCKNVILTSCIALTCLFTSCFMYAYYIDQDSKINKITIADNTIEIIEDFTPPEDVKPGDTITKTPYVKNTSETSCYVRMFVEFSDSEVAEMSNIDFNTTNWNQKADDGFYYYKAVLKPGEQTVPLFNKVNILTSADQSKLNDFDIIVYAESVQSEGFDSYNEAFQSLISSK